MNYSYSEVTIKFLFLSIYLIRLHKATSLYAIILYNDAILFNNYTAQKVFHFVALQSTQFPTHQAVHSTSPAPEVKFIRFKAIQYSHYKKSVQRLILPFSFSDQQSQ